MPQSGRAFSQKELPPSVEVAYYRKCIDLRRRINDIEENNDGTRLRIKRLQRSIQKMRLERAFLLEELSKRMEYNVDDSDRSSSPPPTPTDKPLRSKRSHRKNTPPPGGPLGSNLVPQHASPSAQQQTSHSILQPMNPMSSAQSTPDPSRAQPFFNPTSIAAASPHGVNGTGQTPLPPLHSLPPLHPQRQQPGPGYAAQEGAYYDGGYEDERRQMSTEADYPGSGGRRRAHSGANAPEARESTNGDARDGDTEMGDAPPAGAAGFGGGFTAVNR